MNVLPRKVFIGHERGFGGSLPRAQPIADMFTYLQENYKPKKILEFGFCKGHSATWFLRAYPKHCFVKSYDPKEFTLNEKRIWELFEDHYGRNRFYFEPYHSSEARRIELPNIYDMIFIDAGHTYGAIYDDVETALMLKIPVILIDNMELEPQQKAISKYESNLQLIKSFPYYTINSDKQKYKRYVNLYHVLNYNIREP